MHADRAQPLASAQADVLPASPRLLAAFPAQLLVFTGYYGSGKTEVVVNLALQAAADGQTVNLVDLDFLKPCFRSREQAEMLESHGVSLVAPSGALSRADMPIVLPAVTPLLQGEGKGRVIVDLGGDPGGARALAQFSLIVGNRPYDLVLVVNTMRPFAATTERILQALDELEHVTRLKITSMVANTNLGAETLPEHVRDGYAKTRAAADRADIPVRVVAVPDFLRGQVAEDEFPDPLVWLHRYVLPPWEGEPIGTEGR